MAWVGAGSPFQIKPHMDIFPLDEYGRKVNPGTLLNWISRYDWHGRAEILEAKAIEVANEQIISIKATILRQQFEDARRIADKALTHMVSGTFDSSASAVSAYFRATEEQRRAVGISEIIEKMTKMSDAELEKEILERIRQATNAGQIIDGEVEDTETSEEDSS